MPDYDAARFDPPAPVAQVVISGMSESELKALAEAVVSPEHQQRIQALLAVNREGALNAEQETALDTLLDEVDQVALSKARALYTLQLASAQASAD
jgi:hypothetical protein